MDSVTFIFGGWEPVARVLVVGALAYTALVLLLRVTGKRTLTQMNAFDFIVTVALGASFGRILTARSVALIEAVTAFALLISLQYLVTRLQVRSPRFAQAVTAPPTLLFYRGQFMEEAMQRERLTHGELRTALREQGLGSFEDVAAVVLESDGRWPLSRRRRRVTNPSSRASRRNEPSTVMPPARSLDTDIRSSFRHRLPITRGGLIHAGSEQSLVKDTVIYALDVETSLNSNGDDIGDFQGLIDRLGYLATLGVTCP